jgi:hypothetical protein
MRYFFISFLFSIYFNCLYSQVNITYKVDISNSGLNLAATGIRIGGNFTTIGLTSIPDWTPSASVCAMADEGNGWWSITVNYPATVVGQSQMFKFVNGDWGSQEDDVQISDCGVDDGSGNINRMIEIPDTDSTFYFKWNECMYRYPNFLWSSQVGSGANELTGATAIDAIGNVYIAGSFEGTVDFNPGSGTYNLTASDKDIFVQKLDPSGNFLWAAKYGTGGTEIVNAIDIDENGSVYVCGTRTGSGWGEDVIMIKLTPSGLLSWNSSASVAGNQRGIGVRYHDNHVIYTGSFEGTGYFGSGGGGTLSASGNSDAYIAKVSAAGGNLIWAKKISGPLNEVGNDVQVSDNGDIYVCGNFNGTVDFNPGSDVTELSTSGDCDGYIVKLTSAGNFIWAKQLNSGISSGVNCRSILLNGMGQVLTTGSFYGQTDFDTGSGFQGLYSVGSYDAFVHNLDSSGTFNWVKQLQAENSNYWSESVKITGDSFNDFYIIGNFNGSVDFDPSGSVQQLNAFGSQHIFLGKFDAFGNYKWLENIGIGSAGGIDANLYGSVAITGAFSNTISFNSNVFNSSGNDDLFAARIGPCVETVIIDSICDGSNYDFAGQSITNPGEYIRLLSGLDGCDSLVRLNLLVLSSDFNLVCGSTQQLFTSPPFAVQFLNGTANLNDYSFEWIWGDGSSSVSNNSSVFHEYDFNGTYTVTIVAQHNVTGCSDTLVLSDYIYCTGGTNSISEPESIHYRLIPNPTSSISTLEWFDGTNDDFHVLDIFGRLLMKGKLVGGFATIDLTEVSSGTYFLILEKSSEAIKLVKE